ncbi:hypothetical protein KVR01_006839 [Diaporthe batatas]|uniref:uncharacterized protein n=1 Tax=Diaporthe batatas TaxID=748121 RepID=UPI001D0579B9|nr:uncharacterized protein KVR01_006839 [Diaporthe batatas]KAG8163542.1 hypothetical protein KVR01_006839 [Diaporthe batatas]
MGDPGLPREEIPYLPLVTGLSAWFLYRLTVDRIIKWWSPAFYNKLRGNYEGYLYFLGALLGLLVKPIPLIGCAMAVWKTAPEDDIAGFRRSMNPAQQFCSGSRIIIYISELPHYLHIPELALHHLFTLLVMGVIAKFHISRRGMDLSLASLWAEIPPGIRNLLSRTGHLSPAWDWRLTFYGTLFLFVTRAPATIVALAMIPANGLQGGPAAIAITAHSFHLAYIFRITYLRLKKCGALQIEKSGVFRFQVGDRLNITSTTLLTGLSFVSARISLVLLYSWSAPGLQANGAKDLVELMWNAVLAGTVGLVGCTLAARLQLFGRSDWASLLYAQQDLNIATMVLCLTPTLPSSIDRMNVFYCMVLSSSLNKAIQQYADHLACLQAGPVRTTSRMSLNRGIINVGQYTIFVVMLASGYSSVGSAALKSFLVQKVVEAAANSTMTKFNTFMSLALLTILVTAWRIVLTGISSPTHQFELFENESIYSLTFDDRPVSLLYYWSKFLLQDTSIIGLLYVFFSHAMDFLCTFDWASVRMNGAPRLRTIGLLVVSAWTARIIHLVYNGETPAAQNRNYTAAQILAREPPFCTLLLSWNFWAALSLAAIVPIATAQLWGPKLQAVGQQETFEHGKPIGSVPQVGCSVAS